MARIKSGTNPFYVLLVVVGILFVINVFAFYLMTYQVSQPSLGAAELNGSEFNRDHPLWTFLDAHGETMLWYELAALAVLTFAAIGTDEYWSHRAKRNNKHGQREPTGPTP